MSAQATNGGKGSGVFVVSEKDVVSSFGGCVFWRREQRNVWVVCELLERPVISLDLYRPVNKDQT